MTTSTEHHRYEVLLVSNTKVKAVCVCGWESKPCNNGGFAGSAWDKHAERIKGGFLEWIYKFEELFGPIPDAEESGELTIHEWYDLYLKDNS